MSLYYMVRVHTMQFFECDCGLTCRLQVGREEAASVSMVRLDLDLLALFFHVVSSHVTIDKDTIISSIDSIHK